MGITVIAGAGAGLGAGAATGESSPETRAGLKELPRWTASRLEGTGGEPMPYRAIQTYQGLAFEYPLCLVRVPAGKGAMDRFVVVEQGGSLWSFVNEESVKDRELFLQLGSPETSGRGKPPLRTLGVVFHRDYPDEPFVFVSYNRRDGETGKNRVSRFRVTEFEPPAADVESEVVILEWESDGHNGGDLKFGPDGYLYVSTGDGETPGDPGNVGQTVDNLLGSILRIDVTKATGEKSYRVPEDNPFVGMEGVRPEVWAYGLRNPWRMNFRPGTNELWLGDNGDEHWEMVHLVTKGANYGWSAFVGCHPFRLTNKLGGPTLEHTLPVIEHPHTEMRSVIGGLFSHGQKLSELRGEYLYGCYFTRKLWAVPLKGHTPGRPRRIADVGAPIVSFSEDRNGEPVILAFDGGFFRIEKAGAQEKPRPYPKLLSKTGLFTSTARHELEEGFIPYEVNAPAWRDGATASRHFAVSSGEEKVQIQAVPPGLSKVPEDRFVSRAGLDRWMFPSGTAFVQTFSIGDSEKGGGKRVETQVSFIDRSEWRFLTYAWNETQEDAELVPAEGSTRTIESGGGKKQNWRFMSRFDCAACHTQRSMFVLGATMAQLNREFDYSAIGGEVGNQLETYLELGLFSNRFPGERASWPRFVDPRDESADLDDRARTYLHVNCAP